VLLAKVRACAGSEFGREHNYGQIDSIRAFRENVPISTFEYYQRYVDKVANGQAQALFAPGEQVLMFALTSGTTATAKHIPVTRAFLSEYRRGWLVWGAFLLDHHPRAFEYSITAVVSSCQEGHYGQNIPCGSISGLITAMQPPVIRRLYAPPPELANATDAASKYYAVVLLALAGKTSFLTTANPSTLIACARLAETHIERIIRDIADGTLSNECILEPEIRKAVEKRLKKRPARAHMLEEQTRGGDVILGDLLEGLEVIGCWKGGTLKRYLDLFPRYFPGKSIHDLGLIASEGRMSIPMSPDGSIGILDIASHFYEFIPCAEIKSSNPTVLLAHELEIGQEYFIILSTSSGLFRYNIYDVIRVVDYVNEAPVVEFRNKGSHFSSLTGEKLAEAQVVEAMGVVNDRLNVDINTFTLCPLWSRDNHPGYQLLLERDSVKREAIDKICDFLDRELCRINIEYASKRKSDRLAGITISLLDTGAFDAYRRRIVEERGGRLEQFKHVFLTQDLAIADRLGVRQNGGNAE